MKLAISILLSMFLLGCVTTPTKEVKVPKNYVTDNEDFGVYVRLFELEGAVRGVHLSLNRLDISFSVKEIGLFDFKNGEHVLGLCQKEGNKIIIFIRGDYWKSASSINKEITMFHEMGHCLLGLKHDESTTPDGKNLSMMYPGIIDETEYSINREYYITQLFKAYLEKGK